MCLLEREFHAYTRERQFCQSSSDCVIVRTYCPFGLGVAVNKSYQEEVAKEYEMLAATSAKVVECKYSGFLGQNAVCHQGRCEKEDPIER